MARNRGYGFELIIIVVVLIIAIACPFMLGIGGFGPTNHQTVTVERLYVDTSEKTSHYMVGTDAGVFEVDNGILLGIWDSDEIYSKIQQGKTYEITTEGRKVTNMFFQEYPYITEAVLVGEPEK